MMTTTVRIATRFFLGALMLVAAGCGPGDHKGGGDSVTGNCGQGQTDCHHSCVDLDTDGANCGVSHSVFIDQTGVLSSGFAALAGVGTTF